MKRGVRVNGGDYHYQVDRSTEVAPSSSILHFPADGVAFTAVGDGSVGGGGMSYIEHPVSKMDTLAGVAIRYGVEVTDIKRINGLVTDFQMFALKTLQIPLPGRHPPSPTLSNGFDSQGLKLSPAMCSLQGYYGLKLADQEAVESDLFTKSSNPPLNLHRKCRSVAFMNLEEDALTQESKYNDSSDSGSEKFVRRRQKSESDFLRSPEMLLKEDECSSGGFSAVGSKGLALRPKAASRTIADSEASSMNPNAIAIESGNSVCADNLCRVRRSSSTSNLHDSDSSAFTSLWPITRPIFDGLPKPITGRRNKAALD